MPDKLLKVTNIKTGVVWMKTAEEIAMIKKNLPGRFTFEKEVDAPKLADKIPTGKKSTAEDQAPGQQ